MFPKIKQTKTTVQIHKEAMNKEKSPSSVVKLAMRKKKQVHKTIQKLKDLGIEFSCVIINEPELKKKKTQTKKPDIESFDCDTQNTTIQEDEKEQQAQVQALPKSKLKVGTIKPTSKSGTTGRRRVTRPRPLLR